MRPANVVKDGKIVFDSAIPELIRKVPFPSGPINWEALDMVCEQATARSPEDRARYKKKLFDAIRERGIGMLVPQLRSSYVRARLALGDFSDYWGWEFRGVFDVEESRTYAADCFWSETWMAKWGGGNVPRLLVLAEQGIGDVVFISSMLPEALIRAQEVIFECDPRLHTLLKRAFPMGRFKVFKEREFEDRREDYGPISAFIPGMDLMRMFRRHISHFPGRPFLKPDPERVKEFERFRGRIGVAWKGRQGEINPPKLDIENPVSVQYGESHVCAEDPGIDLMNDLEGVVALCSVLEKVVTVPQSVMHFAGASGVKVEVICPEKIGVENQCPFDWGIRYNGGKLPWYADVMNYADVEDWKSRTLKR